MTKLSATIIIDPISWTAQSPDGGIFDWKYDGDDKIEIHREVIDWADLVSQERWAEIDTRTGVYTYLRAETAAHAATVNN